MPLNMLEVTPTRISCRRPRGLRIGIGIVGLLFGAMCLSLFGFFWPATGAPAERSPADILSQFVPVLLVPLLGLCGPVALFLHYAGPADLILDTNQRTYRFRRGFPLLAGWKTGPLEDIAGLRVDTVRRRSNAAYQLMLDWKNTQASPWTLGNGPVANRSPVQMSTSRNPSVLRQEAQRLAQQIGIPLQESKPVWEQTRSRAQRRLILIPVVLFFVLSGLPPLLVHRALQSQGRSTKGVVTALRHGKGYSVRYAYQVGGLSFQGRASVTRPFYEALDVGSPVTVSYLPAYPHTSMVAGSQGTNSSALLLIYGGVLAALVRVSTRRQQGD